MLPKFWSLFPLPSSLPKIGVVVDLVEKIPPLAAAQANQRFKPTGTRGIAGPFRCKVHTQEEDGWSSYHGPHPPISLYLFR